MAAELLRPAQIPELKDIAPEDIIDNVKSNIYQLFIKTDEKGNRILSGLDRGAISLFGLQNALFLKKTNDDTKIADHLEPEYKNALVDAALNSGCFESFTDDWKLSDGTDEINLYRDIKTHSLGYISDDIIIDVRDDTEGHGPIYTYEFLHYLGFTDREDTEIHNKLKDNIYNNIIKLLDNYYFSTVNSFLRSSVDINFTEEQAGNIKEKYIQELTGSINRQGFEKEHMNRIWILKRKLGEIEDTEKEKVYNAAVSYLLEKQISGYYGRFIKQFENILESFGKPPREPKKHLKTVISKILFDNSLNVRDAAYLKSAQMLYQRIDGHNKNKDGHFFTGKIGKSNKRYEKEATDVETEMERQIINAMKKTTGSFSELVSLYDLIFNKEDLRGRITTEVKDSVSRKKESGSGETLETYQSGWENIKTKMTEIRNFYQDINFADIDTEEGKAFLESARERILDEAGKGIVNGLVFWENVLSGDEDIRSPFKDLYAQWYGSEDTKQIMKNYNFRNIPLMIAREYKTVFGDYPEEFYNGFQDKAVNCLDSLIKEADKNEGEFDEDRAKNLKAYLLKDLTYDELRLLPELHEKISYVNNNYPEISEIIISEIAISEQFRS